MELLSVIIPVSPPNASISRTICPFAIPPIAGLQDICANFDMSIVMIRTSDPRFAAAAAASHPACPAPTTMTSKLNFIYKNYFLSNQELKPINKRKN
jgi:hypothetical protein